MIAAKDNGGAGTSCACFFWVRRLTGMEYGWITGWQWASSILSEAAQSHAPLFWNFHL